jgi:hypothetical protein
MNGTPPGEWNRVHLAAVLAAVVRALGRDRADPPLCPVDGAALKVVAARGLDPHREVDVACPRCRRSAHFMPG